ncbi:Predicted dehydrogenase [Bryocella elongata]|uniref:Predicted dehydrogenase n=1 Tax=Bryocella elongata TaxID=863522 RepID=A0A1H5SVM9_9BACT|nr:Gfo/Idh/MocA family oxidoreductase [Bryocella elongata]SEF54504.1 Predicted dehydrogenase [Bryocella elongata]
MHVRWLVVGIGDITRKRVIPAILSDARSTLAGVVTRDVAKAAAYPGVSSWTTLDAALAADGMQSSFDAVYIATPVVMHAELAIAALDAGKDVLCEKPVAMNFAEAQSIVAAADRSGRLLGVSYYRRLYPKLARAKELLAQGVIGQPVFAEGIYHGWLESEERGWLRDPKMAGGGPLYDVASHRIDALNFLFGKPERAVGMRSNALHALEVEDSATAVIGYAGGVQAVVDARWNSRVPRDEFRIVGVEGEMNLTPLNGPALRWPGGEEELPTAENTHGPLIADFVAGVLDGKALVAPGREAIWTDWVTEQVMKGA